jgi:DNA modification methylase
MTTPYYEDDLVTLYHGDCLDVLPSISDVDLIVTSPPYNLGVTTGGGFGHYREGQKRGGQGKWGGTDRTGIDYGEHNDAMPYEQYEEWQHAVLRACWDSLSDKGAIYYNHKPRVQASSLWLPPGAESQPSPQADHRVGTGGRNELRADPLCAYPRVDHGARQAGLPPQEQGRFRPR